MTAFLQRITRALPGPCTNVDDDLLEEIDRGIADNVHLLNDPESLARSADDRIRRSVAVPTDELLRLVEHLEGKVAFIRQRVMDIIRMSDEASAQAAATVRAETDRLNTVIEALSIKG